MRRAGRPAKPLELRAQPPSPVTRITSREGRALLPVPPADPLLEPHHGFNDDVEILVLGPAGGTDDEADRAGANAEAREQRLTEPLAIGAVDRGERRRRPVVEHVRPFHPEPALEKRGEPARHAEVRVDAPRIAALERGQTAPPGPVPRRNCRSVYPRLAVDDKRTRSLSENPRASCEKQWILTSTRSGAQARA